MGKVCDKYCRNCCYLKVIADTVNYCGYVFDEDKRRPCDPGEGCTVKVAKKRRKKKEG